MTLRIILEPSDEGGFTVTPDFSVEKSALSVSEGSPGKTRREFFLFGEVSQILQAHEKARREKSGIPRQTLKTPLGFFAAALRANFAIAKFGVTVPALPGCVSGIHIHVV